MERTDPWWRGAVVYQIYPRSFADSDGDGIGDIAGIEAHIEDLVDLGVDAVWLSPVYPSPMADFGYDVSDHCDIDPVFGDLGVFDHLVAALHDKGIRIIMDYVPNHTSDRHPWFIDARTSRDAPTRDRYVWRDPAPDGGPPNNWVRAFSPEPAWTFDDLSGQYYLHLFLPEQPDLDWNSIDVRDDMAEVLRFWMRRDVDGFRADVVHCIGKSPDLPDAPEELAGLPACIFDHGEGTHECLRGLRKVVDGDRPGEHLLLGETYVFDRDQQLSYLGTGDELHLAFNFLAVHTPWEAEAWQKELEQSYAAHERVGAWPTWVLSNHDLPRHVTRYGSMARARAAAVMLLTLRGTPFLYQGEELGLSDTEVPPDRAVDPGGRDGCRAPIPWSADPTGGWGPSAWLPLPARAEALSFETQRRDKSSMLNHYRRLLALRRELPVLRSGAIELLDAPSGVLRFSRSLSGDGHGADLQHVEVAINFTTSGVKSAHTPGRWIAGTAWPPPPDGHADGTLAPDEARVIGL